MYGVSSVVPVPMYHQHFTHHVVRLLRRTFVLLDEVRADLLILRAVRGYIFMRRWNGGLHDVLITVTNTEYLERYTLCHLHVPLGRI